MEDAARADDARGGAPAVRHRTEYRREESGARTGARTLVVPASEEGRLTCRSSVSLSSPENPLRFPPPPLMMAPEALSETTRSPGARLPRTTPLGSPWVGMVPGVWLVDLGLNRDLPRRTRDCRSPDRHGLRDRRRGGRVDRESEWMNVLARQQQGRSAHQCPSCRRLIRWSLAFCIHCVEPGNNPQWDDFSRLNARGRAAAAWKKRRLNP